MGTRWRRRHLPQVPLLRVPPLLLLPLFLLLLSCGEVSCNLRCYSCAPCNEFEYFAGSLYHFEADCYFDRYCMKVTGRTTDIFGYRQEVSFRGCPWVSVLATFEEGCTESAIAVAGAGVVEGIFCLCRDHLCNGAVGGGKYNFSWGTLFASTATALLVLQRAKAP